MALDFSLPPEIVELRDRVREFIEKEVEPVEAECRESGKWREGIISLRKKARGQGLWCPHLPPEFGGMGLGPLAMATVSAQCGRVGIASFVLNCRAPDEVHLTQIAKHVIDAYRSEGSTRRATGLGLLF